MNIEECYWLKDIIRKDYPKLEENICVDVAVIGGGISGVLCSYFLNKAGFKVTLFEKEKLYNGSTRHTTAHISKVEDTIYQDLQSLYGLSYARKYYKSQVDSIKEYDRLINELQIDCDYRNVSSNFYLNGDISKLEDEANILKIFDDKCIFNKDTYIFDKKVDGVLMSLDNRTFHPLKFLEGIPKDFTIYEKTCIVDIDFEEKVLISSDDKKVSFNYCVCCTNFPLLKVKGLYPLKMYKSISYNVYYQKKDGFCLDLYEEAKDNGITYRSHNGVLIQGGLDNRCGVEMPELSEFVKDVSDVFRKEEFVQESFESACDSITFDGIPYIGRYVKNNDNVYLVTGFNKYGMLKAMTAAREVTSLIKDKKSLYNDIFNPQRKIINSKYLGNHLLSTMKGFIFSNVKTTHRCTHLHGKLFYNKVSGVYECPCHGSRFTYSGKVIDGPANEDLK